MTLNFKARIERAGNVKTFVFEPEKPVSWLPGQYLHYKLPHPDADERGPERWFTISSAPFERDIWITTRILDQGGSSFKRALMSLATGQTVEAGEPEGDFVVDNPADNHVFVAGGIGITPYRSILNQLHHESQPINIELLYANRSEDEIPFGDELETIAREHENFNITHFIGDNSIDETALKQAGDKLTEPLYYLSGPKGMVMAFKTMLDKLGLDEGRVKLDDFPGYD